MSPTFTDKSHTRVLLKAHSRNFRKRPLKMQRLRGMVAHEGCSTCSQSTDSLKWSIHPASSKTVMIQFLADFTANLDQAYDSINEFIIRKFNPLVVVHFRFIAVFLHAL